MSVSESGIEMKIIPFYHKHVAKHNKTTDKIFQENINLIVILPCWSTEMIQMRPPHSPCQVWQPLHQSPLAMWPAVHPGTQSQRVHLMREGRTAGSQYQRSHHHTCKKKGVFYAGSHKHSYQRTAIGLSERTDLQCPWSHQPCPWHMLGHCWPM